jgi:hypothetical protein
MAGFWNSFTGGLAGTAGGFATPAGGLLGGMYGAGKGGQGLAPWGGGKSAQYSLPSYADAPDLTIDPNIVGNTSDEYLKRAQTYGGPSAWAGFEQQRQGAEQSRMSDQAAQRAGGQAASARTSLGMRGGLTGGAAERLARNAANQGFEGQQNIANLGTQQRAQTLAQDYGNQQAQTSAWAGMQANEQQRREQIALANQQSKAQMWGANQLAQAQLAQANKPDKGLIGGLLGDIF